jgi:D-alanine--poly(phosphoribitol) ligase subunit 1
MNTCIKYLEQTSIKFPNKIAFVEDNREVTFSELKLNALKIASLIDERYQNRAIAVFLPKSILAIECYLGTLYSGNFYAPLDVKSPIERVKTVIKNLEPIIIFTNSTFINVLSSNISDKNIEIINIDAITNFKEYYYLNKVNKIIDTDPIYCIYTSGSTGTPKGVILPHKAVDDFILWAERIYNIDENTIIGNQAPFIFDVSVMDIYLCLKTGATMYIIPEYLFSFPVKLMEYVKINNINYFIWVPSVLIYVANSGVLSEIQLPDLKKILFAGEAMPNKQLNIWRKHLPKALFSNLYGPTEASVIATYYIIERDFKDDESLPIGFPCENMNIIVLNDENKLTKKNEIGELLLKGTGLALGYYNDFEKTNISFIQNPLNKNYREIFYKTGDLVKYNDIGELIYLGRKDSQIKHMGYRIELGDIDNAVMNLNEVLISCTIYDDINKQIILFYESNNEIKDVYFRKELVNYIPKYMLPAKYIKIDSFPHNSNGKIDRKKLKSTYLS